MTILAAALLSGCVTRVVTADRDSTPAQGNAVLFVPLLVLPPDSNGGRHSPDNFPHGQPDREIQAQWICVPARMEFAEPVLFSTDQTGIHFVAIPLAGVQVQTVQR